MPCSILGKSYSNRWYYSHNLHLTIMSLSISLINTLRPRQNGHHFTDDTFNCIFVNENVRISIKFSLTFVPKGPINNIPALVQIMAWCRPGDKPLSESVMVSLLTHICVTRPQWVNKKQFLHLLFHRSAYSNLYQMAMIIYCYHYVMQSIFT